MKYPRASLSRIFRISGLPLRRAAFQLSAFGVSAFLWLALATGARAANTVYTWNNPSAGTYSWTAGTTNWSSSTTPGSGSTTTTVQFFNNTTTALGQPTYTIATDDPATLTLNVLSLEGLGASATAATAVNLGTAGHTWTLDGTTPTLNLDGLVGTKGLSYAILPNLNLNQNITVQGSGTAGFTFSGNITGATSLTKNGTSTLTLSSGANTYGGGTTLGAGTLAIGTNSTPLSGTVTSGPLGTGMLTLGGGTLTTYATATNANTISVTAGTTTAVVSTTGNLTLSGAITGSGTITNNTSAAATTAIQSDISGFTGTFGYDLVSGGNNFRFTGAWANNMNGSQAHFVLTGATAPATFRAFSFGSASFPVFQMGDLAGTGGVINNLGFAGATLQVGALGTSTTFGGIIADNNSTYKTALVKVGTGALTLSNTNTFSGGTTVSNGTLLVNGSITNSVTVAGGTLGGTGLINGVATFNAGTHAVFTLGQPLTFGGSLIIATSGTFPDVHLDLPANLAVGTNTLATYNTNGSSGVFAAIPVMDSGSLAAGNVAAITTIGGQINLVVEVNTTNATTTTLLLSSGGNPSTYGNALTFQATVTPAPNNADTITFMDGSVAIGTGTILGGLATFTTSVLGAGAHSLTAVYAGDVNDLGSTSSPLSQTVNPAPLGITANNTNEVYNGVPFSGGSGVTYSGFVNGESPAVLGGALIYGGTAQGATNIGTYTIVPSGLTATNYTISYTKGTLNIVSPVLSSFPGAVGFGAVATGGRGGTVYHVRNLYDSGPGSFRDAVSQPNRIIVFDVGGFTLLPSTNRTVNAPIQVTNNITIAGQTAPGDGFGVIARQTSFSGATNVICRYIRSRQGMLDGNGAGDGVGMYQGNTIILDHVSIGLGQWDNIDAVDAVNITFQNCIIADPTGQQFNAHVEVGPFCWYRNLWANAHNRQPLARSDTVYVNNYVYDYAAAYTTTTSANYHHDLINNYFVTGPYTSNPSDCFFQCNTNQLFYVSGNMLDSSRDGILDGSAVTPGTSVTYLNSPWSSVTTNLSTVSATATVPYVLSSAGCSLQRDALDLLTLSDCFSLGTQGHSWTNETQSGLSNFGYGTLNGGLPPVDSDQDGMPDYWEQANGLNPNDPTDANTSGTSGYTHIEEYLNWLAGPHAVVPRWTTTTNSVNVDLWPLTVGFTNLGPTYAVSNPTNGVVSLLPDGHTASFSPGSNYLGMAVFSFTVASSTGLAMTNTVNVLVTPASVPTNILWVGDGVSNRWNNLVTTNWFNGNAPTTFASGNGVIFDDTGSTNPAINLTGTLAPALVSFTATNNYTLANGAGGTLSGSMLLSKDGAGTLTIAGGNSFTGGADLFGGTLVLNNATAAGTGSLLLSGGTLTLGASISNALAAAGTTLIYPGANTLSGALSGAGNVFFSTTGTAILNGAMANFSGLFGLTNSTGTLQLNSGNLGSANATFDLGASSAKLQTVSGNVTVQLGALQGGPNTFLSGAASVNQPTTYVIGGNGNNPTTTFPGAISDSTGKTAIVKVGAGTLTLAGANTYTGPTTISNGAVVVNGGWGRRPSR